MSSVETRPKGKQGFASMSLAKRRAIAVKGGRRAHELGVAHRWTSGEEAQAAGRAGGRASVIVRRAKQLAS